MAGKRGHGEGTIYQEKPGHWHGQVTLPNSKRKSVYGKTRRDVQLKIAQLRREVEGGMHDVVGGEQNVKLFVEGWLDHHRHRLRGKTYRNYESIARLHLDTINAITLSKLKPQDLQSLYATKLKTLSATSVQHIHAFVHVVLDSAVRLGIIPRNFADYVDAPGLKPAEMIPLSERDAQILLATIVGDWYEAFFVLALATGMREAELLALRWEDVDWERQRVRVAQTLHVVRGTFSLESPKSRASYRTLPLPNYALAGLQAHHGRQQTARELMGDSWGNAWNLVFTTEAGLPVRYDALIRHFRHILAGAGLNVKTRIHDLRHTFATLLLERGVPIKVVSELLGHSSIGITLQTYGHVTARMRDTAITELNALMVPALLENSANKSSLHYLLHYSPLDEG